MTTGSENSIFQKNPLEKKPGAVFSFDELCDVEASLMAHNANEFDKKILYSTINKVANTQIVEEQYA